MKIRIQIGPDERRLSREDLRNIISQLNGCDHLEKSDSAPRPMEYRVLQSAIDVNTIAVRKIRQKMVEKMEAVISKGA
jgi:hypothetical protein